MDLMNTNETIELTDLEPNGEVVGGDGIGLTTVNSGIEKEDTGGYGILLFDTTSSM